MRKYARIFVLGHSVPQSSEFPSSYARKNCLLFRTDNVHGQISEHISVPTDGYCLYIQPLFSLHRVTVQVLVGLSKELKQIIHIEHNIGKNPNWPEANQLAIHKCGRGFELRATKKQIQVLVRAGLELSNGGM